VSALEIPKILFHVVLLAVCWLLIWKCSANSPSPEPSKWSLGYVNCTCRFRRIFFVSSELIFIILLQLLLHRDNGVQLEALHCLFTYREKYLMPYRYRMLMTSIDWYGKSVSAF
jgi:hypothetical protein